MKSVAVWLSRILEWTAMALVVALSAVAFLGVVDRYALHTGIGWTEEGARFLLIWASFISAAVVVQRRGHFAVMVFVGLAPRAVQGTLAIVANMLAVVVLGILLVQAVNVTTVMGIQTSPALNLPMSFVYASLPVSLVFMLFFLVVETVELVAGVLEGQYRVATVGSSDGAQE